MTPPVGDLLVGYDGSRDASAAIATGARLLPGRTARVVHVWAPPWADSALRHRVRRHASTLDQLTELMEHEGGEAALLVAADGVALARAAGWAGEPSAKRAYGDPGLVLARLAEEVRPAAVVVGSRGTSGVAAVLGSVSDFVVHHSPAPVLVVPPLLSRERAAASTGPVLVGDDGSAGAEHARATADRLLGDRTVVVSRAPGGSARAVAAALDTEAADHDAGVVVVGARGRSALRDLVVGSTAMAVLHHVHRPVLVVPTPS
ncbi:universal stress protein [Actinomycetospora flava]|uniref:Universal stress protein n=1 Tax=Actinomycetospora flava TaxID=3129232 RepID=A0ABU8M9Q9_9PSEU